MGWSDEDKQNDGEDAMKLGARLESANNLCYHLQLIYKQYKHTDCNYVPKASYNNYCMQNHVSIYLVAAKL